MAKDRFDRLLAAIESGERPYPIPGGKQNILPLVAKAPNGGRLVRFFPGTMCSRHVDRYDWAMVTPAQVQETDIEIPVHEMFCGVVACEPGPDYQIVVDDPALGAFAERAQR